MVRPCSQRRRVVNKRVLSRSSFDVPFDVYSRYGFSVARRTRLFSLLLVCTLLSLRFSLALGVCRAFDYVRCVFFSWGVVVALSCCTSVLFISVVASRDGDGRCRADPCARSVVVLCWRCVCVVLDVVVALR